MAKIVACPDCGREFRLPLFDRRFSGPGPTFPFFGVIRCPKCHTRKDRVDFKIIRG